MSQLKKELEIVLQRLGVEANKIHDKEVKKRYYAIKRVVNSKRDVKKACDFFGISTDFFYKWGRRLLKYKGLKGLTSGSKKPKKIPHQVSKAIERKIRLLRRLEPFQGPKRIAHDLFEIYKIRLSPSAVYRALKRLGLITQQGMRRRTKKHLKRYRRPLPGFLQMDVKYVPFRINGRQFYQFNAVDHHSTWRLTRVYERLTHESLCQFLELLDAECPFPIIEIQTDNGIEFTDKYRGRNKPSGLHPLDIWCKKRDIIHRLIPLGEKELNGKVENTHKQDDREFYSFYELKDLPRLQAAMVNYNNRWNSLRATEALGWKTPDEIVDLSFVRAMVFLRTFYEAHNPSLSIDEAGNTSMKYVGPTTRNIKKIRRVSTLGTYLKFTDWLNSNKLLIPLPLIYRTSPSFHHHPLCRAQLFTVIY